jgi:hypothetical protein
MVRRLVHGEWKNEAGGVTVEVARGMGRLLL